MLPLLSRIVNRIIFGAVDVPNTSTRQQVESLEREKGKRGIGWHWLIFADGHVEPGRPLEQPGNHTQGNNLDSIGVGIVGGMACGKLGNYYAPGQTAAAMTWVKEYAAETGLPVFAQSEVIHTRNPYFPCTF